MVHVPALDGLRGVAVIAVMAYHSGLITGGYLGVDVFFALSGFLITRLLVDEYDTRGTIGLRDFYCRRALRLLPALFAFVAVWTVVLLATESRGSWSAVWTLAAAVTFYVINWVQAFQVLPSGIYGHVWSLAIEEQFYLVWPVMILVLVRTIARRRMACVLVVGAAISLLWRLALVLEGAPGDRFYFGTDAHADSLLIGAAASFLVRGAPPTRAGVGAAVVLTVLLAGAPLRPAYDYGITAVAALATAALILAFARGESWLARQLARPTLSSIGRISYGLYLWHFPIFFYLGILTHRAPAWRIALTWVLTFAAALLSYLLVERPALALKRRFAWQHHAQNLRGPDMREPDKQLSW